MFSEWLQGTVLLSALYKFKPTDVSALLIDNLSLAFFISQLIAERCIDYLFLSIT
jgi:hypothetical protein